MRRKAMSRSKDHRVFKKTAVNRKKLNVNPIIPRGGICL